MLTRSTLLYFFHSSYLLCRFSSLSSSAKTTNANSNSSLVDCLRNTYKFTKTQALSISNRFSSVQSPRKPQSVHRFFRELRFSETQIRTVVRVYPNILFSHINKTLKPKVEFFKELGIETCDLGKLFSRNPTLLIRDLKNNLVPGIEILKKIYEADENNKDFAAVLGKCRLLTSPKKLLANCTFLESCGIVGPQLSLLFKRQC